MSETKETVANEGPMTREEELAAMFGNLVVQQANMALMLLGKVANPETGQPMKDIDAARYFIDQLEMLEVKTKGNLGPQESALLKQTLMTVRMAFVDAVQKPDAPAQEKKPVEAAASAAATTPPPGEPRLAETGGTEEHRTKFSKKY